MRYSEIARKTSETDVKLSLKLDGEGKSEINSGCGFLDHMLTLFARHGGFDLKVSCVGDTYVDYHHTTEDIAICLGAALREALGDKRGIYRYGDILLPMDESLVMCAVDISGRGGFFGAFDFPALKVGDFDTDLCEEFFTALCREGGITMHARQIAGKNSHHIIEAAFKAAGRCLGAAVAIDEKNKDNIPSTKGTL